MSDLLSDIADAAILLEQLEGKCDPTTEAPYVRGALAILREVIARQHVSLKQPEPASDSPERGWRVGRHVPRNVYRDGVPVAMVSGETKEAERMAAFIVRACNAAGGRP